MKQVGALPYRIGGDGKPLILLVTSRETKRWVIPKGNPIVGLPPYMAAAREAFEEAGVVGHPMSHLLGRYQYPKRRKDGTVRTATVDVYPLAVTIQLEHWPEHDQRTTQWFLQEDAAAAIDEPELQSIICAFAPGSWIGTIDPRMNMAR